MTNNKTKLQEALEMDDLDLCDLMLTRKGAKLVRKSLKAAQAYADLPSKIEGMRPSFSMRNDNQVWREGYRQALDDILNLLNETTKPLHVSQTCKEKCENVNDDLQHMLNVSSAENISNRRKIEEYERRIEELEGLKRNNASTLQEKIFQDKHNRSLDMAIKYMKGE